MVRAALPLLVIPLLAGALGLTGCGASADPQEEPVADTPTTPPAEPPAEPPVEPPVEPPQPATPEELGRLLFADTALSEPAGTSCASCHEPARGFTGNHGGTGGTPLGSTGIAGLRNTPTAMYASFVPSFTVTITAGGGRPRGGLFADGRADTLEAQAAGPLLAAVEMNNPDEAAVVAKVAAADYAAAFRSCWGPDIFDDPDEAFTAICASLAAFQRGAEFHPFSSRYDDLLRGDDTFTASERRGMEAFFDPARGDCAACHSADRGNPDPSASLFTNHFYFVLGVPRNATIPGNADPAFYDLGLAGPQRESPPGVLKAAGQFRVPTLRNVALKPAFMHNGRFSTLVEVLEFYATRDIDQARWYPSGTAYDDLPAEQRGNVSNHPPFDRHAGDTPRMSAQDISDIAAFLGTLTDAPAPSALSRAQ